MLLLPGHTLSIFDIGVLSDRDLRVSQKSELNYIDIPCTCRSTVRDFASLD